MPASQSPLAILTPRVAEGNLAATRLQLSPHGHSLPFLRDAPVSLVDCAGNMRHIVSAIHQHDDDRAAPQRGHDARHHDDKVPPRHHYLVRWLGPMPDSWEPRAMPLAVVAAYETNLAQTRAQIWPHLDDTLSLSRIRDSADTHIQNARATLAIRVIRGPADRICQRTGGQSFVSFLADLKHSVERSPAVFASSPRERSPRLVERPDSHSAGHNGRLVPSRAEPLKQAAHFVRTARVLDSSAVMSLVSFRTS